MKRSNTVEVPLVPLKGTWGGAFEKHVAGDALDRVQEGDVGQAVAVVEHPFSDAHLRYLLEVPEVPRRYWIFSLYGW